MTTEEPCLRCGNADKVCPDFKLSWICQHCLWMCMDQVAQEMGADHQKFRDFITELMGRAIDLYCLMESADNNRPQ